MHIRSLNLRLYCAISLGAAFVIATQLSVVKGATAKSADKEDQSEVGLIGNLYDFKQTPLHQLTNVGQGEYYGVLDEFLLKSWDEDVLNRFYRPSKPLYTTQIFIPQMSSMDVPKALGVERLIKPTFWVIHYKGEVSPPEAGTYRFVACADDVIVVAVNGKTVLSTRMGGPQKFKWQPSAPDSPTVGGVGMRHGDWMVLNNDETIDLDVLIGDCPAPYFDAFLLIEKKDTTYAMDQHGNPILPIFQVAEYDTPARNDGNIEPLFAKGFPIWKSHQ